ncbi:T9SS type A sorting domain-containing protein [Aureitalea sp. L0-47]|uniref:T9SS type A sorting domain-containing protein n=1 Tax=Aureitalea sp. L0-47 TaxID=2816962 RepID=UPI002238498D|nr:T9SS type A sorting domain-containing protein [Aureitalea sp. L0-47]MCW5519734.1 T9SS type A sorting domain-containing protein [Aureitalea sp. L0-47]
MRKIYLLLATAMISSTLSLAQSEFQAASIEYGTFIGETLPFRDYETSVPVTDLDDPIIIQNNLRQAPKSNPDALPLGADPLAQEAEPTRQAREILVNFIGSNVSEAGNAIPPDPTGAAGPNHYVHGVNLRIKIFDKSGNLLAGPTPLSTFLGSGNNDGDPIVMYDQLADRFFVSQFRTSDDALIIGVSTTPDPTGTYNLYSFPLDAFPDYPHYSVWPDAYYLTANKFTGNRVYTLDRAAMIAGDPNPAIIGFNLPGVIFNPNTVFSPEPANLVGNTAPANVPGYIVYLQDDGWPGVTFDHIKIWEIDVDFVTPGNSTISAPALIPVQPFDGTFFPFSVGDVQQPGTSQRLSSQAGIISYMANYRSFTGHNSFLVNFNVDVDGSNRVGIRWIELRNTGTGPWSIYQEGTWTRNDSESRFMGSMGMDVNGNIALAYSRGSASNAVGIYYTGRLESDPLGQMSFQEQEIQAGSSFQNFSNRFGDYSQMTMDPDGETFWFTSQYFQIVNQWTTKIAAFNLENIPILANNDANADEAEMAVYPLNGDVYEVFLTSTKDLGDVQYEVIDIQGRNVSQGALSNNGDNHRGTFNKGSLATGAYVIRAFNNGSFSQSKKVIIK